MKLLSKSYNLRDLAHKIDVIYSDLLFGSRNAIKISLYVK